MDAAADAIAGGTDDGRRDGRAGDANPVEDRIVDALLARGRLKEADLGRARRL